MEETRDLLIEAGRIVKKDTLLLATSAHLDAVVQLVKDAKTIMTVSGSTLTLHDWLQRAEKVL